MISVILAFIVGFSIVSYAEYTRTSRAMRVIAAYETGGALFSSNYLMPVGDAVPAYRKTLYLSGEAQTVSVNVSVCSYPQNNPTKLYPGGVVYDLELSLMKHHSGTLTQATPADIGNNTVSVNNTVLNSSNLSVTLSDLRANPEDMYTVTISSGLKDSDVCILMLATPHGGQDNVTAIKAFFDCAERMSEEARSWAGEFNAEEVASPNDYDAYNYTLSGDGAGTVTLSWSGSGLAPNKLLLEDIAGQSITGSSISFSVDSAVRSSYTLQFYKTGAAVDLNSVSLNYSE